MDKSNDTTMIIGHISMGDYYKARDYVLDIADKNDKPRTKEVIETLMYSCFKDGYKEALEIVSDTATSELKRHSASVRVK